MACIFYCVVGPSIIFLNKYILVSLEFKYPVLLSAMGMLSSSVIALILCQLGVAERTNASKVTQLFYMGNIMPIGLLIAITMWSGNAAYMYLSVAYIQMLKASSPVILMAMTFVLGMDVPNAQLVSSVSLITVGTGIASFGVLHFSTFGFGILMISNFSECSRLLMQQRLLNDFRFGIVEGIYYIYPAAFVCLFIMFGFMERERFGEEGGWQILRTHPWPILGAAFMGFLINFAGFLVIKYCSSLTLKVLSNARNAAIVLIAAVLFGESVTTQQVVGYTITLVGFIAYNHIKAKGVKQGVAGGVRRYEAVPNKTNGNSEGDLEMASNSSAQR
eukprot:g3159.t1